MNPFVMMAIVFSICIGLTLLAIWYFFKYGAGKEVEVVKKNG